MSVDVARTGESTVRSAPRRRVRVSIANVSRNVAVSEVPDADGISSPLGSVDAATVGVEP